MFHTLKEKLLFLTGATGAALTGFGISDQQASNREIEAEIAALRASTVTAESNAHSAYKIENAQRQNNIASAATAAGLFLGGIAIAGMPSGETKQKSLAEKERERQQNQSEGHSKG